MKYDLLILDLDKEYCKSLNKYIITNYSNKFNVISFTSKEGLTKFLKNNTADILLIDSKVIYDDIKCDNFHIIILLTTGIIHKNYKNYPYIYKYQPGNKIVKEILNILAEKTGDEYSIFLGTKNSKLIGIYSPIGGSGKTCISIGLCEILAKEKNKVLYFNVEDFPSTDIYYECSSRYNLSDLIYYSSQDNSKFSLKIEAVECIDNNTNIHYFCPQNSIEDLENVTTDDWKKICSILKQYYDYIIIDFSSSFNKKNREIMTMCDDLILVTTPEKLSINKLNKLHKYYYDLKYEYIFEKIKILINKSYDDTEYNSQMQFENDKIKAVLPYDKSAVYLKDNKLNININSSFGLALRKIIL